MDAEKLTIEITDGPSEGQRIIKLIGPLTLTTLFDFQTAVRAEKAPTMILDASRITYMDSAGLGAVVNAHVSCTNSGRVFALVGVSDRVRTLLKLTRVESVLSIFPSINDVKKGPLRPAQA